MAPGRALVHRASRCQGRPARRAVLDIRTFLSDTINVRAGEFVRKIEKLGRERGVAVRFETHRGKGSHGTLYYGKRFTVVKDRKKELGPGLVSAMLRQLGLSKSDLT